MPQIDVKVLQDVVSLEELCNALAKLQKDINYLVNGQIDFENVRARSIKAENIETETLTANEIAANTITAGKMNVDELSAISANLGHITAGLIEAVTIIGSLIKTADSGKRVEISSTSNLFRAINDLGYAINIVPERSGSGAPAIDFIAGSMLAAIFFSSNRFVIHSIAGTDIQINPTNNLFLSGNNVYVNNWDKLRTEVTGWTLQQELDRKMDKTGSGYTGEFSVVSGIDFGQQTYSLLGLRFANGVLVETW